MWILKPESYINENFIFKAKKWADDKLLQTKKLQFKPISIWIQFIFKHTFLFQDLIRNGTGKRN